MLQRFGASAAFFAVKGSFYQPCRRSKQRNSEYCAAEIDQNIDYTAGSAGLGLNNLVERGVEQCKHEREQVIFLLLFQKNSAGQRRTAHAQKAIFGEMCRFAHGEIENIVRYFIFGVDNRLDALDHARAVLVGLLTVFERIAENPQRNRYNRECQRQAE